MKSQTDIEALAALKLGEAKCLLSAGFYDGAFYVGGYTIELFLKAMVCKTMGITDFFLFDKGNKEAYRPYKVHDYEQLILLSGLLQYSTLNWLQTSFLEAIGLSLKSGAKMRGI